MRQTGEPALQVQELSVALLEKGGWRLPAVRDVSLTVRRGGCTGVIGESGCGKSLTARALLGLLPPGKWAVQGQALLGTEPVPLLDDRGMDRFRGTRMAWIVQDPLSALDPRMTIGAHFTEGCPRRRRPAVLAESAELLRRLYLPDPASVLSAYPFQLSGGMLQRVLIALAIRPRPELLLADEPTTTLDCTTQYEIVRILGRLQREEGLSILLISHDLSVISRLADTVYVMYGGEIVEYGDRQAVLERPLHPYTRGLFRARPAFSKEPLSVMEGRPPRLEELAQAECPFRPRCPHAAPGCSAGERPLEELEPGHWSRCRTGGDG